MPEAEVREPEPFRLDPGTRNLYITQKNLEKHGYTLQGVQRAKVHKEESANQDLRIAMDVEYGSKQQLQAIQSRRKGMTVL